MSLNQCPIWLNDSRTGAEEILSTPLNGVYISMMRKIAAETDNAQIASVTITVGFGGAKRPKPTKMATSQATRTTSRGMDMPVCSASTNINQRLCRKALAAEMIWALVALCESFFGVRACNWA